MTWEQVGGILDPTSSLVVGRQSFGELHSLDGFSINNETKRIQILVTPADDDHPGLFSVADVLEVIHHGITSANVAFRPAEDLPYHPLKYILAPRSLEGTNFLNTVIQSLQTIHNLAFGTELSPIPPFDVLSFTHSPIYQKLSPNFRETSKPLTKRSSISVTCTIPTHAKESTIYFGDATLNICSTQPESFCETFNQSYNEIGMHYLHLLRLKELMKMSVMCNLIVELKSFSLQELLTKEALDCFMKTANSFPKEKNLEYIEKQMVGVMQGYKEIYIAQVVWNEWSKRQEKENTEKNRSFLLKELKDIDKHTPKAIASALQCVLKDEVDLSYEIDTFLKTKDADTFITSIDRILQKTAEKEHMEKISRIFQNLESEVPDVQNQEEKFVGMIPTHPLCEGISLDLTLSSEVQNNNRTPISITLRNRKVSLDPMEVEPTSEWSLITDFWKPSKGKSIITQQVKIKETPTV